MIMGGQMQHQFRNSKVKNGFSSRGPGEKMSSHHDRDRPSRLSRPQVGSTNPPAASSIMHRHNGGDVEPKQKQKQNHRCDFNSPTASDAATPEYDVRSFRHKSTLVHGAVDDNYVELESDFARSNGRLQRRGLQKLPFKTHTKDGNSSAASSPSTHRSCSGSTSIIPPPPPTPPTTTTTTTSVASRSSQLAVKSSPLPRRNAFSKGINLKNIKPPPRPPPRRTLQRPLSSTAEEVISSSSPVRKSTSFPRDLEPNVEAATSRLRKLCLDIIQSARDGTSTPERAEIKGVVAEYHRSRNNAISPRDPNFVEIPSQFSKVLTYGLARSQTLPTVTTEKSPRQPGTDADRQAGAAACARRSRFSEVKEESHDIGDSRLYTTITLENGDDVESCVSFPSIDEHTWSPLVQNAN